MKIYTSYFYMVRFLKPYQIPISTAKWDPKWFHNFKDQKHIFIDKNGVINGLRANSLHPDSTCDNLCHGKPCINTYDSCSFLKTYKKQIYQLDKSNLLQKFEILANRIKNQLKFLNEPEIILLVHEAPNNLCSERTILQDFFNCTEFTV